MIAHPSPHTAPRRLVDSVVFRAVADAVFRARARRHVVRFDALTAARCQRRILLGLTAAAQATPFGREHDFSRVRTEADFRRLLPLRTPAELRRAGGPTPVAGPLLRQAHAAAWATALACVAAARPQARWLSGRLAFLHGAGAVDAALLPLLARPYACRGTADAADRLVHEPLTCLAGPVEAVASLVDRARDITGRDRVADVWPSLAAVLYNRQGPADRPPAYLRELLGDGVLLLETRFTPDGPIAVEDPRFGCLRFLFDHGVYFEFTPAAEAGRLDAARHTLAEVEPGVVYEMAVTSPAGLWGCRTGVAVRFERRDPPLFRFVEMPKPAPVEVVVEGVKVFTRPACPPPAPHRQRVGIPAGPSGKLAHTPWSAPADRG